jgi:hypothetical protein
MVKLTVLGEATVRRAIDLALAKLARPGCPGVYGDFELPNGGTPQSELDGMGIGPEEWLESLVFSDGGQDPICRTGRAVLTTTPGSRVIRVCPGFARFQLRDPGLSASLIIHESLHALGLGENPPSSNEITQHVDRRCWKAATRMPKPQSSRAAPDVSEPHGQRPVPALAARGRVSVGQASHAESLNGSARAIKGEVSAIGFRSVFVSSAIGIVVFDASLSRPNGVERSTACDAADQRHHSACRSLLRWAVDR